MLAARDVKAIVVACNTSSAVALPTMRARYDVPILGVVRPGATAAALATRTRRVGVIATQATVRSHAYFQAIKDENPFVEVYEHATPTFVPLVEAGRLDGDEVRAEVVAALAPLLGDRTGRRRVRLPAAGRRAHRHAAPRLHPLSAAGAASSRDVAGPDVAVIDSATATASALAGLLEVNGLAAPTAGRTHGTCQLTTGDVAAFERTARRLFGDLVPAVEPIVLAGAA